MRLLAGPATIGLEQRPQRANQHPLGSGRCRAPSQILGGIGRARAGGDPGHWQPRRRAIAPSDPHRADRVRESPVNVRDAGEIERAVAAFARSSNGGLIVTGSALAIVHRTARRRGGRGHACGARGVSLCNENIPLRAADELWRKPARLLPPDVPQGLSSGRARSPTCADRFHRLSVEHLNRYEVRCREHKRRRGSSQMSVAGKVDSLWRYPVKSMRGEELEGAFVGFSGVYGDRLFAFRSTAAPKGFPYLTGREQEGCCCIDLASVMRTKLQNLPI